MKRFFGVVMFAFLVSSLTGCSQNSSVVRGQNPGWMEQPPMMAGGAGMSGGPGMMPSPEPGPMYYDGPAYGYSDGAMCPNCPTCPAPKNAEVWRPTHHHTWEYKVPQNLVYPPQNQQPGVYQYPYYTVKGPSDFFYTGP